MEIFIIVLCVFFILAILLTQRVNLRLIGAEDILISLNFIFWGVNIYPLRNMRKKDKPKKKNPIISGIKTTLASTKAFNHIIDNSDIKINKINIESSQTLPSAFVIRKNTLISFLYFLLSILSLKSNSLTAQSKAFSYTADEDNNIENSFDVSIDFRLFYLINAGFIFLINKF